MCVSITSYLVLACLVSTYLSLSCLSIINSSMRIFTNYDSNVTISTVIVCDVDGYTDVMLYHIHYIYIYIQKGLLRARKNNPPGRELNV